MFERNLKHDALVFDPIDDMKAVGEKLFDAFDKQNGTEFVNTLSELISNHHAFHQAQAVAYAIALAAETAFKSGQGK